jgi:hypothetical protein
MKIEKKLIYNPLTKNLTIKPITSKLLLNNFKLIKINRYLKINKQILFKSLVIGKDIYFTKEDFIILDNLYYPIHGEYFCN